MHSGYANVYNQCIIEDGVIITNTNCENAYNKEEFENISSLDDIVWENFAEEVTWTLPNNNGLRRIYMLLKDEAGNVSLSLK